MKNYLVIAMCAYTVVLSSNFDKAFSMDALVGGGASLMMPKFELASLSQVQTLVYFADEDAQTLEISKVKSNSEENTFSITDTVRTFNRNDLGQVFVGIKQFKEQLGALAKSQYSEDTKEDTMAKIAIGQLAGNLARFFLVGAPDNLSMTLKFENGDLLVKMEPVFANTQAAARLKPQYVHLKTYRDVAIVARMAELITHTNKVAE